MSEALAIVIAITGVIIYFKGALGIYLAAYRKGMAWFLFCILSFGIGFIILTIKEPRDLARPWLEVIAGIILSLISFNIAPEMYQ